MKCDHRGYEFLYSVIRRKSKVRRIWKCCRCWKPIRGVLPPTKNQLMVRDFKDGMSRKQVARLHRTTMARVENAIRKAL